MKKVLITSSFTGTVEVIYGEAGIGMEAEPPLLSVEFGGAVLNDRQRGYLMAHIPVRYGAGFEQCFDAGKFRFVVQEHDIVFDDFWEKYGKKINKVRCEPLWNKLTANERVMAFNALWSYDRFLMQNNWRTKADPETYLKKKMWLNEWDKL